jgi:serine/threonine protein phosphatase PrpC
VARTLADTANDRGGHDNITVVVVDIDPSAA